MVQATSSDDKTAEVVAVRVKAAQRRASRNNALLALGVVVTFVALGAAGLITLDSPAQAQQLQSRGPGLNRGPIEKVKGQLPTRTFSGREIFDQNRGAIYLIGWLTGNKVGGLCTAFAIKPTVLATNAPTASTPTRRRAGRRWSAQSGLGTEGRFHILACPAIDPGYKPGRGFRRRARRGASCGSSRPHMPSIVTLANDAGLRALPDPATIVCHVIGFPGQGMDPISPSRHLPPGTPPAG